MKCGNMHKAGDVILATVQFTDTKDAKIRPALVLFEELGNIVIAGITSNTKMKGIPLLKEEGAITDSVIKLNYLFTVSEAMVYKTLFRLNGKKRKTVFDTLVNSLNGLAED